MANRLPVRFVDEPEQPFDRVVVAVAAIDAFDGRVVTRGVEASIEGLPDRPRRNLSGLLVFVNLPEQAEYRIYLSAVAAGYFDPEPVTFVPPADGDPDWAAKRRLSVPLLRRPETATEVAGTTVAGVVQRAGVAVAGASVEAELPPELVPPGPRLRRFEARSDERGAFALSLRLPDDPARRWVAVTLILSEGGDERRLERPLTEGEFHSFEQPIDLADVGADAGVPGLRPLPPEA